MERRQYLRSVGAGCTMGLVSATGCLSDSSPEKTTTDTTHSQTTAPLRTTQIMESDDRVAETDFRKSRRDEGEPIAAFNEFGSWKTTSGRAVRDKEETYRSKEALQLIATDQAKMASARYDFSRPQDFIDRAFSMAVKWQHNPSTYAGLWLSLYDATGDYIQFSQSLQWENFQDWHRVDLGIWEINGKPNLEAITSIEIMTWAGDGRSRVLIADAQTTAVDSQGSVMLTFDDSRVSQHSVAFPLMEDYGYPGAIGVITQSLGQTPHMDLTQLNELYAAGWDMCSHPQFPNRPLTEFSKSKVKKTLGTYKRWLLAHGFERGAECIIYPFGLIDDQGLDAVAQYHKLGFKVAGQTPYGSRISSPLLASRVIGEHVDDVKEAITLAGEYGLVVPIMYHGVDVEGRISQDDFEQTLRHISDTENVRVITPSEWLTQLETSA